MNYILIVDDEEDIRDIYEMILRRAFPLDVVVAESGNKALNIIKTRGMPEIIISDLRMPDGDGYFLYQQIQENKWKIPFVVSSTDAELTRNKFPDIHGFIEKPNITAALIGLVDAVVSQHKSPPTYVPIRISLLLRSGTSNFDLYMKLSDTKFIKVINAGEAFIPSDAERFRNKGLEHLLITAGDAESFLKAFEKNLSTMMSSETVAPELVVTSLETLETVERIASSLGWTPAVIHAAKNAVNLAVKAVSAEPNLLKIFKNKLSNPQSIYSSHVGMSALLSCGFCHNLGWVSESTQMKLGLASLMHDIAVDEKKYEDIMLWNQAASDLNDKSAEISKYRNHPAEAANLLLTMKDLPADVDQIILQHHEMKDGTGFPRGLISSRISPMASVFIIVEDLINFLEDSTDFDEKILLFIKYRESRYNSGNFKKVFDVLKETVEKAKLKA